MKCLANFFFGKIEYGIATRALIAGVDQSVERERIVFRRSDLFFNDLAENAELDGVEMHVFKVPQGAAKLIMKNTYAL